MPVQSMVPSLANQALLLAEPALVFIKFLIHNYIDAGFWSRPVLGQLRLQEFFIRSQLRLRILVNSVLDPNTLNLVPEPGFWLNLDPDLAPDPGPDPNPWLYYQF